MKACSKRIVRIAVGITLAGIMVGVTAQEEDLTVSQIMTAIITPMTNTLWGAYDIQEESQWQALENAALTIVAAGTLLKTTGPDTDNQEWKDYNQQMVAAARAALVAIGNRDEEALSSAGNDQLYPPCESCHQRFMGQ